MAIGRAYRIKKSELKGYGYTKPPSKKRASGGLRPNASVTHIAAINGRGSYARSNSARSARSRMAGLSANARRTAARSSLTAAQKSAFAKNMRALKQNSSARKRIGSSSLRKNGSAGYRVSKLRANRSRNIPAHYKSSTKAAIRKARAKRLREFKKLHGVSVTEHKKRGYRGLPKSPAALKRASTKSRRKSSTTTKARKNTMARKVRRTRRKAGSARKRLKRNKGTRAGALKGWRKRRAKARKTVTRKPKKRRKAKAKAKSTVKRKRRKVARKPTLKANRRRRMRRNKGTRKGALRGWRVRKAKYKASAYRKKAPKRRRKRAKAKKTTVKRKRRKSARRPKLKANRRRRSHRRNRRSSALKSNRRRRSRRSYRSNKRRALSPNRRRRSSSKKRRSGRRLRRNGRKMFRKNGVTDTLKFIAVTGGLALGGLLTHKLATNLLTKFVFNKFLGAPAVVVTAPSGQALVAAPATAGLGALNIDPSYQKLGASAIVATLGILATAKFVKNPTTRNTIMTGFALSFTHTIFQTVASKFFPQYADMLSGADDGTAARLSAMYGLGASIMPRYSPINGMGEYFQGTNGLGEYFQGTAGLGEYFQGASGLGALPAYEAAAGMGSYSGNPDLYEAAAGMGASMAMNTSHVDPHGDLDNELNIAEAAAGVGSVPSYEAAAGFGNVSTVPSSSTWIPGSSNGQIWAGTRAISNPQSATEMVPAGILQTDGGQGVFG